MKKVIGIILIIVGLITSFLSLFATAGIATANTVVIGGADGPTSVFVAGTVSPLAKLMPLAPAAFGLILIIIGVIITFHSIHKEGE